jgi:hypothetical protein
MISGDISMNQLWRTSLWQQFGATIDMLDNALVACPDALWRERLWHNSPDHPLPADFPPEFAEFWYIAYHTLFWLDLYLSGVREEDFSPPAPFIWTELGPSVSLARPYTKEDLRAYLASLRRRCHDTLVALTDERARQIVEYPWTQGQTVSFLELQMYNMRHVHEHTAQLSLFLGQHGIPDEALDWVCRARTEESGE